MRFEVNMLVDVEKDSNIWGADLEQVCLALQEYLATYMYDADDLVVLEIDVEEY